MKRNTIEYICGSTIKQCREEKGYAKLKALAMEMGNISVSKLSKIETGNQRLDIETIYQLSLVLDTSMTEIMARIEKGIKGNLHKHI